MTRTERFQMLQDVVADRVKNAAYKAYWIYSHQAKEVGTYDRKIKAPARPAQ